MNAVLTARAMLAGMLIGVPLGAICGWSARGAPVEYVIETPAPSVHYADGSVLAERRPGAATSMPAPKRPARSTVTRTAEITIQPSAAPAATAATPAECAQAAATFTCPPVRLRLDVLETADGFTRVGGKTPDGTITSFLDIPTGKTAAARRNRLILIGEPKHEQAGAIFMRDFGRLSLGAGMLPVNQEALPVLAAGWSL